jgi:hypothetical protein
MRGTHKLLSTKEGTQLGYQEKAKGQGALTNYQAQRVGQIKTLKKSKRSKGTYTLLSTKG